MMKQPQSLSPESPILAPEMLDDESVVAGQRLTTSIDVFRHKCEVHIAEEQEKPLPDNALIDTLCEAVRMTREYTTSVYASRSDLLSAARERDRLRAALAAVTELLRAHRIVPVRVQHGQAHCRYCLSSWRPCDDEPETHAADCLAAPTTGAKT